MRLECAPSRPECAQSAPVEAGVRPKRPSMPQIAKSRVPAKKNKIRYIKEQEITHRSNHAPLLKHFVAGPPFPECARTVPRVHPECARRVPRVRPHRLPK